MVVGEQGDVLARGYREFAQLFPRPGWVEHEPDDIWTATVAACREALAGTDQHPTCIGITDQRETAVVWDRRTLHSPRPAIVWQDRRTTGICDRLRDDEERVGVGGADDARARDQLRQRRPRDVEQVAQLVGPAALLEVEQ